MVVHLSRIGRRWRIAAAVACLLLAAVTALADAGRPGSAVDPHSRPVLVAARALPAGHTVTRHDLTTTRWPDRLAPPDATAGRGAVLGRVLAGPLARGEPVTSRRLVDAGLTTGLDADTVAVPVDLDTDVRGLVRAGDLVDLLAVARPDTTGPGASGEGVDRTARSVRILAVLPPSGGSGQVDAGAACRVVLAVSRDVAVRMAGLRTTHAFTVVVAAP